MVDESGNQNTETYHSFTLGHKEMFWILEQTYKFENEVPKSVTMKSALF
jgi:hypothetical protein